MIYNSPVIRTQTALICCVCGPSAPPSSHHLSHHRPTICPIIVPPPAPPPAPSSSHHLHHHCPTIVPPPAPSSSQHCPTTCPTIYPTTVQPPVPPLSHHRPTTILAHLVFWHHPDVWACWLLAAAEVILLRDHEHNRYRSSPSPWRLQVSQGVLMRQHEHVTGLIKLKLRCFLVSDIFTLGCPQSMITFLLIRGQDVSSLK